MDKMAAGPFTFIEIPGRETVMQEAFVGNWAQEGHISGEMLRSLHDLNHRFLDLIASGRASCSGLAAQLAPLSSAQRAPPPPIAPMPCSICALEMTLIGASVLHHSSAWRMSDDCGVDDDIVNFVRPGPVSMPGTSPPARIWVPNCCWE